MRSLIILEVEHGEDTDALQELATQLTDEPDYFGNGSVVINDYTVRVDLPACFVLDSGMDMILRAARDLLAMDDSLIEPMRHYEPEDMERLRTQLNNFQIIKEN